MPSSPPLDAAVDAISSLRCQPMLSLIGFSSPPLSADFHRLFSGVFIRFFDIFSFSSIIAFSQLLRHFLRFTPRPLPPF